MTLSIFAAYNHGTTKISVLQIVVHDFAMPLRVIAELIVRTKKLLGFQPSGITGCLRGSTADGQIDYAGEGSG